MFGFPAQSKPDGFRFPNNLLRSVTFQLKYRAERGVQSETSALISALLPTFPVIRQINRARFEAEASSGKQTPQFNSEIKPSGLQFSVNDDSKVFVLNGEMLTMTYSGEAYSTFSEAYSEYSEIIKIVEPILAINSFYRVAIRKINGLQCEIDQYILDGQQPWLSIMHDVFSPNLLAGLDTFPNSGFMVSSLMQNRFQAGDNRLNLVYGIPSRELGVNTKQLLLDIDLSNESDSISKDSIDSVFVGINDEIFNIFSWAVKPEFLDTINA